VDDITAVLGTQVCYRDPNVGRYGLENALFPLGADVLEVVAPIREGTAAGRFLERSGGRGGYMAILDCDDAERRRARAEALGLRVANVIRHDGYLGVQLHPRDCRAAMLEFNHTVGGEALAGPYHPAGPEWPQVVRPGGTPSLLAAEVESPDPSDLAAHGARIMEVPISGGGSPGIRLLHGTILFVPAGPAGGERLIGLRIGVQDVERSLAVAAQRGLRREDGSIWLCGVRLAFQQVT
jgi:hypothetical protein